MNEISDSQDYSPTQKEQQTNNMLLQQPVNDIPATIEPIKTHSGSQLLDECLTKNQSDLIPKVISSENNVVLEENRLLNSPKKTSSSSINPPKTTTITNILNNNILNETDNHSISSMSMSQSWNLQASITSIINTFVMDSCLNSCIVHPQEPISFIDVALDCPSTTRFHCIECFSLLPEDKRGSIVSLRKFLINQESDPNFALFDADKKQELIGLMQSCSILEQNSKETYKKQLAEFNENALIRFREQLQNITTQAEVRFQETEQKEAELRSISQELSDSKILLKIFENSKHNTDDLCRLVDEYIRNCHSKVSKLKQGLDELKVLKKSFSVVSAEESVNKILNLASQISFLEAKNTKNNEQSIIQEENNIPLLNIPINKLSIDNDKNNNNETVIQLLKQIPRISNNLLKTLEQRIQSTKIFEGIDFQSAENKLELTVDNIHSQLEIQQVCEPIKTDSTVGSIDNKCEVLQSDDIEETLSQSQLSEFVKQALDDKVTLSEIKRDFVLKQQFPSNNSVQSPQFPLANEFTLGDISPLMSKNIDQTAEFRGITCNNSEIECQQQEISFGKDSNKRKSADNYQEARRTAYQNTISKTSNDLALQGEKFQLSIRKSKLGSNGDVSILNSPNGVITIQNPCDTFMHQLESKECLESRKSYNILFELTCSRSDQLLIGIIPKQNIKDKLLHSLPFYKSFVSSSQQTHNVSCERIEKGSSIKIFSMKNLISSQDRSLQESETAQTIQVLMHISISTRQLSFSDYPEGLNCNSIMTPNDLSGIEQFYLSIALSKPRESSLQQPLCVQILDARVSQSSVAYRKTY